MIENVKGLLSRAALPYFNYIIQQLQLPEHTREKNEKWKEHRARLERLYTGGKNEGLQYRVIYQVWLWPFVSWFELVVTIVIVMSLLLYMRSHRLINKKQEQLTPAS